MWDEMEKGQREKSGLGGEEDRRSQRGSGRWFRTHEVWERRVSAQQALERLGEWGQVTFGCRNVGALMGVVWRSPQTGVGLRGPEEREAGRLLTSPWNHLQDITEVAKMKLGSMPAKCSISSWMGSWNRKQASLGKLVNSKAWSLVLDE